MSGIDLCKEIRKIDNNVRICFLTAFDSRLKNLGIIQNALFENRNNRRFSRKNKERIKEELGKYQCEPIEYIEICYKR